MSRISPPARPAAVRAVPGDAPAAPPRFVISGQLRRPLALTVADLRRRWPQRHAPVVFDCATNGPQHHTFDGPLLRDVLDEAGPAFDVRRRKDRSRFLLTVSGGDGHHAVLSWAEIDADFGDAPILLATAMDGRPLDTAGSQLVVPSDRCGARYISAITGIWVGTCPPPGAR
ncbi:molybdopterin-dependent oxidoreductase [Streptomyces sp. NRRL F-4489]|uniref:molybdopterin-dependent oxidoreductase n=1 Tax=Streptomyces sp. NRRL F-4489 TaxID=1609095 RepID=UPI00074ACB03|nr:molybdopterin-dependent oxidoreductase [Streptomyces sp. NRRL F-4489]KUL38677.1 molybdopterin-dependent oxidoreductase [Streptomyces sp. NRRL F-4489]